MLFDLLDGSVYEKLRSRINGPFGFLGQIKYRLDGVFWGIQSLIQHKGS